MERQFDTAFDLNVNDEGECKLSELSEYLGLTDRTMSKRIKELA